MGVVYALEKVIMKLHDNRVLRCVNIHDFKGLLRIVIQENCEDCRCTIVR